MNDSIMALWTRVQTGRQLKYEYLVCRSRTRGIIARSSSMHRPMMATYRDVNAVGEEG
jgi:hypothetical protein